jgi:hypothetical protein
MNRCLPPAGTHSPSSAGGRDLRFHAYGQQRRLRPRRRASEDDGPGNSSQARRVRDPKVELPLRPDGRGEPTIGVVGTKREPGGPQMGPEPASWPLPPAPDSGRRGRARECLRAGEVVRVIGDVALRKRARRHLRRPAAATAIVRPALGHDDQRDSDVAEAHASPEAALGRMRSSALATAGARLQQSAASMSRRWITPTGVRTASLPALGGMGRSDPECPCGHNPAVLVGAGSLSVPRHAGRTGLGACAMPARGCVLCVAHHGTRWRLRDRRPPFWRRVRLPPSDRGRRRLDPAPEFCLVGKGA